MNASKGVFGCGVGVGVVVIAASLFALAVGAPAAAASNKLANPISPPYPPPGVCLPGVVAQFPATNCQIFYVCTNGVLSVGLCPPGLLFDRVTKVCQPAAAVDCAIPPVIVVPPPTTAGPPTAASTARTSSTTKSIFPVPG